MRALRNRLFSVRSRLLFWWQNTVFLFGHELWLAKNAKEIITELRDDPKSTLKTLDAEIDRIQTRYLGVLKFQIPLQAYLVMYLFDSTLPVSIGGINLEKLGLFNDIIYFISLVIGFFSLIESVRASCYRGVISYYEQVLASPRRRFFMRMKNMIRFDFFADYISRGNNNSVFISNRRGYFFALIAMLFLFILVAIVVLATWVYFAIAHKLLVQANFGHEWSTVIYILNIGIIMFSIMLFCLHGLPLPYTNFSAIRALMWATQNDYALRRRLALRSGPCRKDLFFEMLYIDVVQPPDRYEKICKLLMKQYTGATGEASAPAN